MKFERILIAESDGYLAEVLAIRLSNAGYQVTLVDKEDDVVAKTASFEAGAIILDQSFPHKDSFEICYELRMNPKTRGIGILLLTSQELDLKELARLGVRIEDQLVKPFNPREALHRINRITAGLKASEFSSFTGFPGWEMLRNELSDRLASGGDFDLLFMNISNFRAYNHCYGYDAGDEIIRLLARIIRGVTDELETPDLFIAHFQGDEFAIMLPGGIGAPVGQEVIARFEREISEYYLEDDCERGGMLLRNREGQLEQKPLMTLAVALVSNLRRKFSHPLEVRAVGEELLKESKKQQGSRMVTIEE